MFGQQGRERERECGIWKPLDHPAPSMLQLAWLSTWSDCGEYGLWHVLRALRVRHGDGNWSQAGVISPQVVLIKSREWQLGFERARLWKKAGCFWKSLILLNVNVCQVIMIWFYWFFQGMVEIVVNEWFDEPLLNQICCWFTWKPLAARSSCETRCLGSQGCCFWGGRCLQLSWKTGMSGFWLY